MWWQILLAGIAAICLFDGSILGLLYIVHWRPSQRGFYPHDADGFPPRWRQNP